MNELPHLLCETEADWEQWLADNHATSQGVWLKIAKKDGGKQSVSYQEALGVGLCFGWIDGQKGKLDDAYFLQKFTPRRKNSRWSLINRDKVTVLIEQGKMHAAGLREVEAAQADGRWDAAYASQSQITVPDDLQAALDANESAKAFFAQLNSVNRYAILYRIQNVKKAETRTRKIAEFVQMLADNKQIYP
ncbi:MAG: YdeI/OmpD-associated family protein [Armatimonadetes bacterium]|nr:YdeI/OmpD-associated family protein [Anaerolineae bacterium]